MARRRIWAWVTEFSACFEYRVRLPLEALPEADWEVEWGAGPPPPGWEPDVVIGQRLTGDVPGWLELCADPSVLAVYEMDDDLINIDPANTVPYNVYSPVAELTRGLVEAADAVVVCTPHVADVASMINPRVFLLPICMDPNLLRQRPPQTTDAVSLGWAGSAFHHQDWEHLTPQLPAVVRSEPYVTFTSVGSDFTAGAFGGELTVVGYRAWSDYIPGLDFDLGVAPLRRSEWNRGKSWTKPLEYATRGIPVVAEAWGQYAEWVEDGVNGVLVRNPEDWTGVLVDLLDADSLRNEMAEAAYESALAMTIDKHVGQWAHVYAGSWS